MSKKKKALPNYAGLEKRRVFVARSFEFEVETQMGKKVVRWARGGGCYNIPSAVLETLVPGMALELDSNGEPIPYVVAEPETLEVVEAPASVVEDLELTVEFPLGAEG